MSELEFTGKSVVITGAAAGMGKAITLNFLKKGATVIAVDLNQKALDELEKSLSLEIQKKFISFAGDVSKQEVNEAMIEKAVQATGEINVLVNNAGIAGHSEPISETTNEDWNRILDVNLNGPGAIRTGMTSNPELESEFGRARIMSGMDSQFVFGETSDIAEAVLYLASERASFINGAKLVVDGGISCN